jgi:hypothetical protein
MWESLEDDPNGKGLFKFGTRMKSMMSGLLGQTLRPYIFGFDWPSLGSGTVIDVGGGNGHVEIHLL